MNMTHLPLELKYDDPNYDIETKDMDTKLLAG